jgi:hypothetical protein
VGLREDGGRSRPRARLSLFPQCILSGSSPIFRSQPAVAPISTSADLLNAIANYCIAVTAHAFRYRDSSFAADLKRNGPTHLVEGDFRATTALERDALLQIYLAPVDRPLAADDSVFGPVWVQQKLDDGGSSIYLLTVDSINY